MTSAPTAEGRSSVTLGLAQALGGHLKVNALACVRQPSLGFRGKIAQFLINTVCGNRSNSNAL